MNYQLSCESTVDMPFSYIQSRNVSVLFYSYTIDGKIYPDNMERDPHALAQFYRSVREGKIPATSQINVYQYCEHFRKLLPKGDLLHISFGSGLTPSVQNAVTAAQIMKEEFPDRKIVVVDSLCGSSGYGLLVDCAADLWEKGTDIDELETWLLKNRTLIHHQFFTTDVRYFHKSGRISGPMAKIATILNICPIMRLNRTGHIIAYDKARGQKAAMQKTVDEMVKHAQEGRLYQEKIFIAHSDCLQEAKNLKALIAEKFSNLRKIQIFSIGTIIASHCGPGTVSVYFWGDERPE